MLALPRREHIEAILNLEKHCKQHVNCMAGGTAAEAQHLSKPLIESDGTFQNPWNTWQVKIYSQMALEEILT